MTSHKKIKYGNNAKTGQTTCTRRKYNISAGQHQPSSGFLKKAGVGQPKYCIYASCTLSDQSLHYFHDDDDSAVTIEWYIVLFHIKEKPKKYTKLCEQCSIYNNLFSITISMSDTKTEKHTTAKGGDEITSTHQFCRY